MKVSSVFYYAGSGKEVQGHKSLMMIDSTYAENEPRHTAQLDDFMMEISTSSDLSIFILDTCFVHFENRETSEVRLPNESLVIYAGENPSDHCTLPSQHNHGHFTGCFLEVVEQAKPGTSFNHIVDETMQLVKDTGHQIPWICKSSTTRFALF
ncbi:hypothetical protein Pelo_5565 [Pelomyxa schiedti]|nr:hypothetical protein Pelo_5565 [Pelomyxa schiedti]